MVTKVLVVLLLLGFSFKSYAFFSSTFPRKVKNQCDLFFNDKNPHFASGQVSVIIDLKNKSGELEEKAYIYLDCGVDSQPANHFDLSKAKMECQGVRINGLDKGELTTKSISTINPVKVDVKVYPEQSRIVAVCEGVSTFIIDDQKQFTWKMKSKLSRNSYKGTVKCEQ